MHAPNGSVVIQGGDRSPQSEGAPRKKLQNKAKTNTQLSKYYIAKW